MDFENYARDFEKLSKVSKKEVSPNYRKNTETAEKHHNKCILLIKPRKKIGELNLQRYFEAFAKTINIKDFQEFRG